MLPWLTATASRSASSGVTSSAAVVASIGLALGVALDAVPTERTRMFSMNSFETCRPPLRVVSDVDEHVHAAVRLDQPADAGDVVDAQPIARLPGVILTSMPGPVPDGREPAGDQRLALEHGDARDAADQRVGRGDRRRPGSVATGHSRTESAVRSIADALGEVLRRDDERTRRDAARGLGVLEHPVDAEGRERRDADRNVEDEGVASASHVVT